MKARPLLVAGTAVALAEVASAQSFFGTCDPDVSLLNPPLYTVTKAVFSIRENC